MRGNSKNPGEQTAGAMRRGLGLSTKLIGVLMPVIALVLAVILFLVYSSTSKMILQKNEENLQLSTDGVINNVSAWMNKVITALEQQRDVLQQFDLDEQGELAYIKHTANQYDAFPAGIYLGLSDGSLTHASFVPGPEYDIFKKPWYVEGLKSEDFILGAIYYDEDSQKYVVGASGVLKSRTGSVRGVAAADIYLDSISQIVSEVKLEETGGMLLIDRDTDMIIGHRDSAKLGTLLSDQIEPMYGQIATLLSNGASGLNSVDNGGSSIYLDIKNVPQTRWTAISYVPSNEVMSDINRLTQSIAILAFCSIVVLLVIVAILLRQVVIRPVRKIDIVARRIAQGHLDEEITYRSGDELGELAENFNQTVNRLRDYVVYIDEISTTLEQIAAGNLRFSLTQAYNGEFEKIKLALEHISLSLNDTLGKINQSADQVSSSAGQVSSSSQALSQSTTEQAASVESLANRLDGVSEQVRANAQNAASASERAALVRQEAAESNQRMQDMLASMHEISSSSSEIAKIMKAVEDIAFQTNILALNAAVEAARAGVAGKGFAVVADEVRNLASKSADASKSTASLIENSLRATGKGAQIADETAQALASVVNGVEDVAQTISKISQASSEQAESIQMVDQGVVQISAVVQQNSATAEQSAAASEELSAQAIMMRDLVGRFQLNQEHDAS